MVHWLGIILPAEAASVAVSPSELLVPLWSHRQKIREWTREPHSTAGQLETERRRELMALAAVVPTHKTTLTEPQHRQHPQFTWQHLPVTMPSVLWHCWLGIGKSIQSIKNWVMRWLHGYLSGSRYKWFADGPADAIATPITSCFIKVHTCLTFLVATHPEMSLKRDS